MPKKSKTKCNCKDIHSYFRKSIQFILSVFIIVNAVLGFLEVILSMVVNFLINHNEGFHGFTDAIFTIKDITSFEHKEWELTDPDTRDYDLEKNITVTTRFEMINHCSTLLDGRQVPLTDDCELLTFHEKKHNFMCAVIEHPEVWQKAYKPLLHRWIAYGVSYLASVPFMMLAVLWKTQCSHLILMYSIFQIIPITISFSIVYSLWVTFKFELCSLDYIYNSFPTKIFFTCFVVLRVLFKAIEILSGIWYVWEIHLQKERKGFGFINKRRRHVDSESVTVNDETLLPYRPRYGDELSIRQSENSVSASIDTIESVASEAKIQILPSKKAKNKRKIANSENSSTDTENSVI